MIKLETVEAVHTHTHTHTHTCILNKQGFKTEKLYILLKNIRIGY